MKVKCKCGCGEFLQEFDDRGRKRQYVIGHAWRGRKHKESTKIKMGIKSRGNPTRFKNGKDHPNWVGDKVSYPALHTYVHKHKPKPDVCEICKIKPPIDVANISGKYKRDFDDWQWLCRSCHIKSDGRFHKT